MAIEDLADGYYFWSRSMDSNVIEIKDGQILTALNIREIGVDKYHTKPLPPSELKLDERDLKPIDYKGDLYNLSPKSLAALLQEQGHLVEMTLIVGVRKYRRASLEAWRAKNRK